MWGVGARYRVGFVYTRAPSHRRVYQDLEAKVRVGVGFTHTHILAVASPSAHRWFVLKGGKIFWFKSDIVTPVRVAWHKHQWN